MWLRGVVYGQASAFESTWRPAMMLYLKARSDACGDHPRQICLVYRGVNFMTPEAAEELFGL